MGRACGRHKGNFESEMLKRGMSIYMMTGLNYIGFEVLTAVVIKSTVFWGIPPCSLLKTFRRGISPASSVSKNKPTKKPA
jgi:hypothetical protein